MAALASLQELEQRQGEILSEARWARGRSRAEHMYPQDRQRFREEAEQLNGKAEELEPEVVRARLILDEQLEEAERSLDHRQRMWALQYVDALDGDATEEKLRGRLDEARQALEQRRGQHRTAAGHLKELQASRDPDDVDRIAEAETEVERARRHVELVAKTVAELEFELGEAEFDTVVRAKQQVVDRQEQLHESVCETLDTIDRLIFEDEQLRAVVVKRFGRDASVGPLMGEAVRERFADSAGRIRSRERR